MHARAYGKAAAAVASSALPVFYSGALKALWLIDSATLLVLSTVFALVAAKPAKASSAVIILLALIPAATAAFLYVFIGLFLPAHLLLAAALLTVAAGILAGRRTTR